MPFTPLQLDSLVVLLTLFPCLRLLRRMGLSKMAVLLLFFSTIIPLLGHFLFTLYVVSRRWPALPIAPQRVRRTR